MTISLALPPGATLVGELRDDFAADELDQDILQISLPGGVVIDVGWRPEYELDGEFEVVVYRGDWDNPLLKPVREKDPLALADIITDLAREYGTVTTSAT
jgi:hypothetical protein